LLHSLAGWRRLAGLFRELAGRDFDVAIDLQGLFRSGVLCFATRAPTRIGLRSAREGARTFYTDIADDHADGRTGAVHRYWRVAELLGIGPAPIEFPLCLTDEELDWARRMLAGLPRPVVGVCPGARWRTKRWPAGSFAESLNAVVGRAGGSVALVGGADETAVTRAVAERLMVPHIDLCGQTSLRRLPALFRHCDAVLTNDSGPMHLAAAVGARIVSIFTCTAPERAAPFGQEDRAIATTVACKASYLRECPTMHCMRELTPARVIPALAAALSSAMPAPSTSSPSFPAARIPKAA
jgi:lipopolysaccharide heptosyltransferase II